jgi:hypothetical protein
VHGEARPSERRERLAVAELRHPEERPSVGSAEARVEEHFAVVPEEQELRPRASRRELKRVEALGPPVDGARRRKAREAHRHRRRERVGLGRRALVARSRERVEPDDADPDGDREPDHDHDERRQDEERERVACAVLGERIVAVAPGLIGSELIVALCDSGVASPVCAGKGAGVATAGRSEPAEPLELAGEPPGAVTLRILLCLARTP